MMKIQYSSGLKKKTYQAIDGIAREWLAIGRQLGLDEVFLNSLSGHGDITAARDMIDHWLHTDKNATWTRLITAMRDDCKLKSEAAELETALLNKIPQLHGH